MPSVRHDLLDAQRLFGFALVDEADGSKDGGARPDRVAPHSSGGRADSSNPLADARIPVASRAHALPLEDAE
jgi:hypothetical protein